MLYIKFEIQDSLKFADFKKLYNHMVNIRQPGFEFNLEPPSFDWGGMSEEAIAQAIEKLDEFHNPELREINRYKALIPDYATDFLERYLQGDNKKMGALGIQDLLSVLNYLEYGFEVDLDILEMLDENFGIIEFSTGNFPYGGMERFLITLKAFGLIPTECYDGFSVCKLDWPSNFEHKAIELPEETKEYLNQFED